jgi:ribosome-associated toxin RatA of RatAB toxin-antitoxin module
MKPRPSRALTVLHCLAISLTILGGGAAVRADDAPAAALHQRLDSLDDHERKLLSPFMERGPVALVELTQPEVLPAIVVGSYVEAGADEVAAIIARPANYPKFMPTLDHVDVLSATDTQIAYKWTWQTGVIFLEGENRMTVLRAPADHPELGHRISIKSERGQLGEGRIMWRIFPVSAKRSMVVLSLRVDMRDANFVMRQLDAAARSVNRSVNIALSYVMLLGTKREAERVAGAPDTLAASTSSTLSLPAVDVEALKPVLERADVLFMELAKQGPAKLTVLGRSGLNTSQLAPVMGEPEIFGRSLVPGSYARVTAREGADKTFDWGIGLPLIGTSGSMHMHSTGTDITIDATEGALHGGKWRFGTKDLQTGEAVIIGVSRFDIAKSAWVIEKIASLDPAMGHGLGAATQVMLVRALRKRARDEVRTLPAPAAVPAAQPGPTACAGSCGGDIARP